MWLNKLPKMVAASVLCLQGELQFSLHLQDTLQDQQVGLTQVSFTTALSRTTFKSGVSFYFPQPSGSPESKPHWPSKPNVLGLISSLWTPGQGVQSESQTHCYLWKVLCSCLIMHSEVKTTWYGLDYTTTLPLSSVSLWFLSYVFHCRRSLCFLMNTCSANSGSFGVPLSRDKLRVFLLWHLGQALHLELKKDKKNLEQQNLKESINAKPTLHKC